MHQHKRQQTLTLKAKETVFCLKALKVSDFLLDNYVTSLHERYVK